MTATVAGIVNANHPRSNEMGLLLLAVLIPPATSGELEHGVDLLRHVYISRTSEDHFYRPYDAVLRFCL